MGLRRAIAAALLISAITPRTHACPVCDSDQGRQVRAGVFNDDFPSNTLQTLATFPVILGLIIALYAAVPNPARESEGDSDAA